MERVLGTPSAAEPDGQHQDQQQGEDQKMRIDHTNNRNRDKKKKKKQSTLDAEIFAVMEKSLKSALDLALDDLFKGWKGQEAEAVLNRTTSAFFRFLSPDGRFLFYRGQPQEPSAETKMPLRERVAHAFSARGFWSGFFTYYAPGHPFGKTTAFIDTSGRLQEGRKQAQNSLILFREFPPPFPEQG